MSIDEKDLIASFDKNSDSLSSVSYNLILNQLSPRLRQRILNPPQSDEEKDRNIYYVIKSLQKSEHITKDQIKSFLFNYRISDNRDLDEDIKRVREGNPSENQLSRRFSELYKDKLSYCSDWEKWLWWNGNYWEVTKHQAIEFIRQTLEQSDMPEFRRKASTVKGVEYLVQSDPNLVSYNKDWDKDHWLLTTPKGTVYLKDKGKLCISYPQDKITKITSVSPEKGDPILWLKFLNEATENNTDYISYLQRVAGYCITGSTCEETLFFLYGDGGNGKGVFINTIREILNDYETVAPMAMFAQNKFEGHSTDLAMLRGARLVTAQETEEGKSWNESRIKTMTGGDAITARFIAKDNFTFMPNFKLLFAGNNKPNLKSVDAAHRRRFQILPFTHKPLENEIDKDLKSKLKSEHGQILQWMIDGCLLWQEQGLNPPQVVKEAITEYFNEQDKFKEWLDECCDLTDPNSRTVTDMLFNSWQQFAIRQHLFQGTSIMLAAKLRKHGLKPEADIPFGKGLRGRGYLAIKLNPTECDRLLGSVKSSGIDFPRTVGKKKEVNSGTITQSDN